MNRFDVYVNGDFVGIKPLSQPYESIEDLNQFLEEQGCYQFETHQQGDRYDIEVNRYEETFKKVLQMYLQMR